MKGKQTHKRVNPTPMITTISRDFQPCFEETGVKKPDTYPYSHSTGEDVSHQRNRLTIAGVSRASQDETETAASLLIPFISHRGGDAVLALFRIEACMSVRHGTSIDFN